MKTIKIINKLLMLLIILNINLCFAKEVINNKFITRLKNNYQKIITEEIIRNNWKVTKFLKNKTKIIQKTQNYYLENPTKWYFKDKIIFWEAIELKKYIDILSQEVYMFKKYYKYYADMYSNFDCWVLKQSSISYYSEAFACKNNLYKILSKLVNNYYQLQDETTNKFLLIEQYKHLQDNTNFKQIIISQNIFFEQNKITLTPESKKKLHFIASFLYSKSNNYLIINSYLENTDEKSNNLINKWRAELIKNFLIDKKILENKIKYNLTQHNYILEDKKLLNKLKNKIELYIVTK